LVNELPVEDYLRGMGEVSESDAKLYPEKVKALIVSARSYVLYYANPKLPSKDRKFPGKPYDISDNPDESQQYKGYGYESRSPSVATLV
jgi:peptidoglycan hydrolase-like amidase